MDILKIKIKFDTTVLLDESSKWSYLDEDYSWANCRDTTSGNYLYTYEDEFGSEDLIVRDPIGIVEDVDTLLEPHMPMDPGMYKIKGDIELVYAIDAPSEDYDFPFKFNLSSLKNFKFSKIGDI